MKRSLAALFCLAVTSTARAEVPPDHFAQHGSIILSADRLFGVSNYSATTSQNGRDQTVSGTQANLVWGSATIPELGTNPYTTPRLSFDYAVVDNVTVGGSIGYALVGGKTEANGQSSDRPSTGTFATMARGGYVFAFGPHGLWLRGGLTYFNASTTTPAVDGSNQKSSASGLALSFEPTFVLAPTQHVGFTAGLVVDFPLTGSSDSNGQSVTMKVTNYGVLFGVLVHF